MPGERQRWSGREWPIIRKKKPMEVENAMFKQDTSSTGLTPLRFVTGALPRRKKKTAEDLERGWSNRFKADISKQPKELPCFAFRDNGMKCDFARYEFEKPKKGVKVEGWVNNFAEQKKKELDEVYGKDSSRIRSTDKRLETAWVGNTREEHRGKKDKSRVILAELQRARAGKRLECPPRSGKTTERSSKSTSRPLRCPKERCERFLHGLCFRSPKGIEAELLSMDSSYGDISDPYAYFRQEHENYTNADMGWMGRTREAGFRIQGGKTAEETIRETEDQAQEDSWFNAYQCRQKRELLGLRSFSIGDNRSKRVNGEDLSWAANCRAKLKPQITAAA